MTAKKAINNPVGYLKDIRTKPEGFSSPLARASRSCPKRKKTLLFGRNFAN